MPAVSSALRAAAKRSPSSRTTGSTRCSTAARKPPASRSVDGDSIVVYKELGLVSQVFDEVTLGSLAGHIAVGHTRYSTTGSCTWENAQPSYRSHDRGGIALGHNGNLTNTADLAARLARLGGRGAVLSATTDSEIITGLLANSELGPGKGCAGRAPAPRGRVLPRLLRRVDAVRGPRPARHPPARARPARVRRAPTGWVVASETAALDIVGAALVREVEAGEMLVIDDDGVRSSPVRRRHPARLPVRVRLPGAARHHDRRAFGACHPRRGRAAPWPARRPPRPTWSSRCPTRAPRRRSVTRSRAASRTAPVLVKNAYVGRTFIQPSQTIRQLGIRLKLNPLREVIAGKRLVVVDDSVVRGNTQRALVKMLRESGAAEVHVRISSPPVRWPCFYGIDFATRDELIATGRGVEQIRELDRRRLAGLRQPRGPRRSHEPARQRAVQGLLHRHLPRRAAPDPSTSRQGDARAPPLAGRRPAVPRSDRRSRPTRRVPGRSPRLVT